MSLIFPSNPTLNQTYQTGSSATYRWNGTYWVVSTPPISGLTVATASYAERVVWMQPTPPPTGTGSLWYDADTGNMYVKYDASWVPAQSTIGNAVSASFVRSASFASTASSVNTLNQAVTVSGSFTVFTGSNVELQVTDTGVRLGNQLTDRHHATGSLNVTGSIVLNGAALTTASSVPTWINAGTITTFPATTTTGSISNWSRNGYFYRQVGAKAWEVNFIIDKGNSGNANNGSGDYLFSLPAACPDFDVTQIYQGVYQGGVNTSEVILARFMMPTSNGFANHNITVTSDVAIIPWGARQYRVVLHVPGNAMRCWGSGWFPLDGAFGVNIYFSYQAV